MYITEATTIVKHLLNGDYFQDFSSEDRINDPDGIYDMESEITDSNEEFYWNVDERKAFKIFADLTSAERAAYLS